jgi:hypothetical protein
VRIGWLFNGQFYEQAANLPAAGIAELTVPDDGRDAVRFMALASDGANEVAALAVVQVLCPEDLKILSGGYKLVTSELPPRHLLLVESRPVPERRQWAVTLLYEPPKPAAVPAGEVKIEVWAVCTEQAVGRPGELSQKRL